MLFYRQIMNENFAKVRPYFKSEIADLYQRSVPVFIRWLDEIETELKQTGYYNNQKIFTIKQVELIFKTFGHPKAKRTNEIYTNNRVSIIPYTKKELASLYEISGRTLIAHIESIADEKVIQIIMDGNDKNNYEKQSEKKLFKINEVKLIFEYLGQPYIN